MQSEPVSEDCHEKEGHSAHGAAVPIGFLAVCAALVLTPDEGSQVCHVVVDRQFGSLLFQRNVLSTPAGGLAGAAMDASHGLIVSSNILVIITAPVGAAIGAAAGSKFNASMRRREQRSTS